MILLFYLCYELQGVVYNIHLPLPAMVFAFFTASIRHGGSRDEGRQNVVKRRAPLLDIQSIVYLIFDALDLSTTKRRFQPK
jgi:hypothetical protein